MLIVQQTSLNFLISLSDPAYSFFHFIHTHAHTYFLTYDHFQLLCYSLKSLKILQERLNGLITGQRGQLEWHE